MALNMKTSLFLLSTWLAVVVALAQDSPIGGYSMSEWAHTNLNVNRALETGAAGKLLGYKSTGVIGLLDPASGGGGFDTNAVAAVPDSATLTNSVTGYTKAIVGTGTTQKLYQRVALPPSIPTSEWTPLGSGTTLTINADNSVTATGGTANYLQFLFRAGGTTAGEAYTIGFYAKANEVATIGEASTSWSNPVWATPLDLGTSYNYYEVSFTAANTQAYTTYRDSDSASDSLTVSGMWFHSPTNRTGVFPNGTTVFASAADPGYGWQQVYLESQGGGSVGKITNLIPDSITYTGTIPADSGTVVVNVSGFGMTGDCQFLGTPTVAPGDFIGQRIGFLAHNLNRMSVVLYDKASIGHEQSGLNCFGTTSISLEANVDSRNTAEFIWDGATWVQYLGSDTASAATLLPAPWPPPDTNGVQTLPANVKDAFLVELVPWFLTNSARLFPNGLVSTNAITP
jgi:hypothetical protein